MEVGKPEDWREIHVCVYAQTSEPTALTAYWFYENSLVFAGLGISEPIDQSGYVAFSLEEAMMCSDEANFHNYLADDVETRDLPSGKYYVRIYQGEDWIDTFYFEIED
jgi:hypothetical protein